jgi:hypothetical protein
MREGDSTGTSTVKKAAIKKANEAFVKARILIKGQEKRENESVQGTITSDQLLNTEFGSPDELPNQIDKREVEPIRETAMAK